MDSMQLETSGRYTDSLRNLWQGKCGHYWDRRVEDTDECQRCALQSGANTIDADYLAHSFAMKFGLREQSTFPQAEALERDLRTFLKSAPATAAVDAPAHRPGDPHTYRAACTVCGQEGTVRVTLEPQWHGERE